MAEKRYTGHRKRLRERFLAGEEGAFSDEAILELLLTCAIPRKDIKPIAQELIRVFGSLSQVISASPDELSKVKDVGQVSIVLLKAVDFIKSAIVNNQKQNELLKEIDERQLKLFKKPTTGNKPAQTISTSRHKKSYSQARASDSVKRAQKERKAKSASDSVKFDTPRSGNSKTATQKSVKRKFQVSNGYNLEFDQFARVLHFLLEKRDAKKISRKALQEETGLAERQVGSLASMGAAMGLMKPGSQVLTPTGLLIAEHDIFIENRGSLQWCHYVGAGSFRNLVWFEVFNNLLSATSSMTQSELSEALRYRLEGLYTKRTIGKHLQEEVRFVIDAYTERNFSKLELLHQSPDKRLYRRRYTGFVPLVLTAMIYDFCAASEANLFQISEMTIKPGSPAVVFGLDAASFREQIEGLHERGWLRYETTHNLDQIRLKPGFSALEFLAAYFIEREPREVSN